MRKIAPPPDLLLLLLALGYWIYLLGRAWHIPVTHDEAATSLLLSKHNYTQLVFYRYDYISANNHVLNSLLAKFFSDLSGGLSPLSIRAGNLLAAIAYLGAGGVLIRLVFQSKWLRPWRERQRERAILSNVTLGLALLIVLPISRIKKAGDFTWFGNNGFFKDTVQGFLDCFLLGKHCFGPNTLVYLQILLVVLFAISSIAAGVLVWKNRGKITPLAWLVGLFPATVLTNLLVTAATDSSHLSTRTTLFFSPLLFCSIVGLLGLLEKKSLKTAFGIAALLASLLGIHFVKNANWAFAYEWRYDRDTYTVLNAIEQKYKSENRAEPWSLCTHCLQWPSFLFHIQMSKSRYRHCLEDPKDTGCEPRPPDGKDAEFYYIPKEKAAPFAQYYDVMLETSDGERVLLRRKP